MALINGAIPGTMLFPISSVHDLVLPSKLSWDRMANGVYKSEGWRPTPVSAYRSLAIQKSLFYDRYTTRYTGYGPSKRYDGKTWWRKTATTPPTATPGTSNHGWGNAVDILGVGGLNDFSHPHYKDLVRLAGPYGWDNNEGRSIGEPWHWVYKKENDQFITTGGGDGEEDMPITQADADLIVGTLLNYANPSTRPTVYSYIISAGSKAHTASETATEVWNTPVNRGATGVPIIQDNANGTTAAVAAAAAAKAALEILEAGGTGTGGGELNIPALVDAIADEIERRLETAKIVIP